MSLQPSIPALHLVVLLCALCASLSVRPWRLLAAGSSLATPLLAMLTVLPWLWSWPAAGAFPIAVQFSGAPLAVLMLGWPLAVPVLALAGLSTILTSGASWQQALAATVWSGVVPATLVLVLGHAARRAFGTHPAGYLMARAYAVPLLALFASTLGAATGGQGLRATEGDMLPVACFLLALAEAAWTCAVAALLVAGRPQWLATWSDALYLGPQRERSGSGVR